jgi:hypothetical protein
MFFMYAAQRLLDREANIFNALFLSAAVILMIFPHEIYSLGFQLSYGATLGILLFHSIYRKTLSWLPAIIANSLALTISAQILVLPVLLIQVSEINLVGLLSNIIVVPLMSLILLVSLAANALPIDVVAAYAAQAADAIYNLNLSIVRFISGLNGHFYVETVGPALIAAFCLLAIPLVPRLRGIQIMSLLILVATAVAWLTLGVCGNVRQDDITAIRHRQGTLLLVKNGITLSVIGELPEKPQIDLVQREISIAACREVNLHITNPDYRNITGYTYLLKQLPVRRCYLSGGFKVRKYTRRFFDVLERDRAELIIHDCGPDIISGETADSRWLPEQICGLYQRITAGGGPVPIKGFYKKKGIRYLTLH